MRKNQSSFDWVTDQKALFWNLDLFLRTDTMREKLTVKVKCSLIYFLLVHKYGREIFKFNWKQMLSYKLSLNNSPVHV